VVRVERRSFPLLAACLGLVAVAGCAASAGGAPAAGPATAHAGRTGVPASPLASGSTASPPPAAVNVGAFDKLARQEAVAWAGSPLAKAWRAGLVILAGDDLSSGPSGGFPSGQDKMDFIEGDLIFTGPPPSGGPAGVVTWPDGATMKVPVLSEARTFSELTSSRECPSCVTTPLDVTAATPTTLAVGTSRGLAKVPAWAFTLKGVSGPVIQAALPPGSYVTPGSTGSPSAARLAPLGKAFTGAGSAAVSADGRTLTLRLFGGPCDATWGGLETEADGAIVVGGWEVDPHPDVPCAAMLISLTTTVRLPAPVGDRVIIDASTGQPVTPPPALADQERRQPPLQAWWAGSACRSQEGWPGRLCRFSPGRDPVQVKQVRPTQVIDHQLYRFPRISRQRETLGG
jgi:hypothetical protein